MKQKILSELNGKLTSMGITAQQGNGADITIKTEFLDTRWSTGSKKISYEASVFANEQDKVVYMYEKTTEVGNGLSFGKSGGTSFQNGKTLYRKVKSTQYSIDGKAYEYSFDLGAISKAVKETAKLNGWGFKTVINKNKAMYPKGYVPLSFESAKETKTCGQIINIECRFCSNCGMPLTDNARFCDKCGKSKSNYPNEKNADTYAAEIAQSQTTDKIVKQPFYNNSHGEFYANVPKKNAKKCNTLALIAFILMGIVLVAILLISKATLLGWIFSILIFSAGFFLQQKIEKRGCLSQLILLIATAFVLLIGLTIFTTEDISVNTAKLKNAHMATAMNDNGKPADKVLSYAPNAPQLVAVAELHDAPQYTKVKFVWSYVTGGMPISEYLMDSGEEKANVYVYSYLTNVEPWPEGEYKVEMYVEDRKTPDATVKFLITSDTGATGKVTSSQSMEAMLPYEKSFPLNDGKSTGTFKIFISDGTGRYEAYKGKMICEFWVSFDTSSLPADFIMDPKCATENNEMGTPATDGLIMAVCSDTEAYHCSALSDGEWIFNGGNIRPFVETDGSTANVSSDTILELALKYPKIQVLRYNQNEVGMTRNGDTWITHSEKAFGLHPPITEGYIPWSNILSDLKLK